jgi:hypothetical protein
MLRHFLADETDLTAIDFVLIGRHRCIQQIFVLLPIHEPAREAQVVPCNAARYSR